MARTDHSDEIRDLVRVDESDLFGECRRHASRVLKYSTAAAEAKYRVGLANNRLKVAETEARMRIKANPQEFGLDAKPTVDDIKAAVVVDQHVQNAQMDVLEAEREHDHLKNAVSALFE
jgi:hypothetical protein